MSNVVPSCMPTETIAPVATIDELYVALELTPEQEWDHRLAFAKSRARLFETDPNIEWLLRGLKESSCPPK